MATNANNNGNGRPPRTASSLKDLGKLGIGEDEHFESPEELEALEQKQAEVTASAEETARKFIVPFITWLGALAKKSEATQAELKDKKDAAEAKLAKLLDNSVLATKRVAWVTYLVTMFSKASPLDKWEKIVSFLKELVAKGVIVLVTKKDPRPGKAAPVLVPPEELTPDQRPVALVAGHFCYLFTEKAGLTKSEQEQVAKALKEHLQWAQSEWRVVQQGRAQELSSRATGTIQDLKALKDGLYFLEVPKSDKDHGGGLLLKLVDGKTIYAIEASGAIQNKVAEMSKMGVRLYATTIGRSTVNTENIPEAIRKYVWLLHLYIRRAFDAIEARAKREAAGNKAPTTEQPKPEADGNTIASPGTASSEPDGNAVPATSVTVASATAPAAAEAQ